MTLQAGRYLAGGNIESARIFNGAHMMHRLRALMEINICVGGGNEDLEERDICCMDYGPFFPFPSQVAMPI